MTRIHMKASLTFAVGGGLAHKGEEFEAANEEDARLYEEKGLAKRKGSSDKKPERTQDVQSEEEPKRRGRPPKQRQTKDAGNPSSDVEEADDGTV